MQPTVLLRPATPEDYGLALELYLTTMQSYTAELMTWDEGKQRRSFAIQWNIEDALVIVVDCSDAGWVQIKESPSEILLQQIFVAPAHQRRGIGTETIRQLLTRFGKRRKPMLLTVLKNNPARRLYERLGFSVVGEIGVKFVMRWDAVTGTRFRRVDFHDHAPTRKILDEAFSAAGDRSEDTARFLDTLRADGCILGEWLAEGSSGIIGHIVFSRVWLEQPNSDRLSAAMLTPLAVRPDRQRCGIGTQLIEHALQQLEAQGETLFFVLGHPDYYPRVGFRPASVESPWPGNRAFMVRGSFIPEGRLVMPGVIADAH